MQECTFAPVINQSYPADDGADYNGQQQPRSELMYQNFLRKKMAEEEGYGREKTTLVVVVAAVWFESNKRRNKIINCDNIQYAIQNAVHTCT